MSNFDVIQSFYKAWAVGDLDQSLAYCTDDLVWDNVPLKQFEGKERVRGFLEKFGRGMSNVRYEIKQYLEVGDSVMIEAVENYEKDGHSVAVPYMACFSFKGQRISEMRDYFDLGTVERQLGLRD
jgi:limonene-1,2-epoxide hydrolase